MATQVEVRPSAARPRPADRSTAARATPAARPRLGRGGRVEGLDGVRALAVLAVLVYHLRPQSLPGGFLGVDVFFVVSGFLITTLLLRELTGRGRLDLPRFWLRRARRLLPALVGVVLVTVPLAWAVSSDLLVSIGRQTLGALTFSSNWLEIAAGSSYFTATAPQLFVNFWSLAVEEQFYLLWPLLLVAVVAAGTTPHRRVQLALAAAGVSALLMAVRYTPGEDATRVYYGTDTHLFGLMIGVALAFAWAAPGGSVLGGAGWQRWRHLAGPAAVAGLLGLMLTLEESSAATFRGGILTASLLSAVVVAALLGPTGPFQRLLRLPAVEWVGQRSYGIYLWHWPVIVILTEAIPTAHDSPGHWAVRALALALTLLVAAASFRWLEQPVRRDGFAACLARARAALADRVPARRLLARGAAATAALLVLATAAAISVAPERSQTQVQIEEAQAALDAAQSAAAKPATGDFSMPTGEDITGFGDSIVVTSKDGLEQRFPGIMLDARSIRQWPDGEAAVEARLAEGSVRRAVFLDFGTNAGVNDEALVRRVLDALGEDRMIVVVNLYGGSEWVPAANETLERIVADYPNAIIADWHGAISAQPGLLQADGIHPGIEGAHLYADVVADAFAALSERVTGEPVADDDTGPDASPSPGTAAEDGFTPGAGTGAEDAAATGDDPATGDAPATGGSAAADDAAADGGPSADGSAPTDGSDPATDTAGLGDPGDATTSGAAATGGAG
ncbi:acyltransferase [Georgenia sp. TF02-10]|uniref:acyltransferase family protein n=1 Tax=Georgenia sp. TF02-10 TaxID=2917725 RepID=UPI001FA7D21D|nr:acyltransferase family protein [Georgenia sp. TF02-10]UNX54270.1 acyltransferase [Georgenia sp. TF02-10]